MSVPPSRAIRGTSSRVQQLRMDKDEKERKDEGNMAARREVALKQLAYEQEQLSKGVESVRDVMQYIFWAFGVGILAATRWRETIVIVPVFWTAWMMHAMQRTYDSTKHLAYARWLEGEINEMLPDSRPILRWNSDLASEEIGRDRPHINEINLIYWGILNVGSWIATDIYFAYLDEWILFKITLAVFLVIYVLVGTYLWRSRNMLDKWAEKLKEKTTI